jgi:hypothetical protein
MRLDVLKVVSFSDDNKSLNEQSSKLNSAVGFIDWLGAYKGESILWLYMVAHRLAPRSKTDSRRLFLSEVSERRASRRERLTPPPRPSSIAAGVSWAATELGAMRQHNDGNDDPRWKARSRRWGKVPVACDTNRRH